MTLMVVLGVPSGARADQDAAAPEDASTLEAGSTFDGDASVSVGDDEAPVGLQPTVFDSNLGCTIARAGVTADPSPAASIGLFLALVAMSRRSARPHKRRSRDQ